MKEPERPASGSTEDASDGPTLASSRSGSGRRRRRRWGAPLAKLGLGACLALTAGAPLAAGAVHQPVLVICMVIGAVAVACLTVGLWQQQRDLRIGWAVVVPLVLLLIPLLQSVPLPLSLRSVIDPKGTELLRVNDALSLSSWPLSLDPPATRVQ